MWRTKERDGTSITTHMVWDGTMLGLNIQLVQYVRNSPKGNLPLSLALYHTIVLPRPMWLPPEKGHFFHSICILTWTELAGLSKLPYHARPPLSCRQWEKVFMAGDRFGDTVVMAAAKGGKLAILRTCLDIEARDVSNTSKNWVRLPHAVLDALRDSHTESCICQAA